MPALPLAKLVDGVKVAVRVKPVPLIALKVPLLTTTSPVLPFQLNVEPGSSLKVKVMVAVSPAFKVVTLLEMVKVGAKVSMLMLGVLPAPPELPVVSV